MHVTFVRDGLGGGYGGLERPLSILAILPKLQPAPRMQIALPHHQNLYADAKHTPCTPQELVFCIHTVYMSSSAPSFCIGPGMVLTQRECMRVRVCVCSAMSVCSTVYERIQSLPPSSCIAALQCCSCVYQSCRNPTRIWIAETLLHSCLS